MSEERKKLEIQWAPDNERISKKYLGFDREFKLRVETLAQLAVAESNLIKAKKSSAMSHFIAIVKMLEDLLGFRFVEKDKQPKDGYCSWCGRGKEIHS